MMRSRYTTVNGQLFAEEREGDYLSYTADDIGSTIAIVKPTATITDRITYWPYGEEAERFGTTSLAYTFGGVLGYRRAAKHESYVRSRWLVPEIGAWMSDDPIDFSPNPYRYAEANPLTFVDPDGLQSRVTTSPPLPTLDIPKRPPEPLFHNLQENMRRSDWNDAVYKKLKDALDKYFDSLKKSEPGWQDPKVIPKCKPGDFPGNCGADFFVRYVSPNFSGTLKGGGYLDGSLDPLNLQLEWKPTPLVTLTAMLSALLQPDASLTGGELALKYKISQFLEASFNCKIEGLHPGADSNWSVGGNVTYRF